MSDYESGIEALVKGLLAVIGVLAVLVIALLIVLVTR